MSIKYKFNEYTVAYGQQFIIDPPQFTDSNITFTLSSFNDIFKINESDGSIFIDSNVNIGIYNLVINKNIKLKIIIKPNITYKITSFYNNNEYSTYLPITNPYNLIGEYCFDENYEHIYINNETGEISFSNDISAGNYTLVIKSIINNIEQKCITTFNIYPIVKYGFDEYYCEKHDLYKSDIPYAKPSGGMFKFNNDYSGITIDNSTGQITINKPKSGNYNLVINYKINNVSINTNVLFYVKPIIAYEKTIIAYEKSISEFIEAPSNTDTGGIYKLEQTSFNKNLSINSSTGKITIKNQIPSGLYFIKVYYTYNNYTTETISEISITPNIYYVNNRIELIFGNKYQTEKPLSDENINGLFSLTRTYDNIHVNPNNGILYFSNGIECNDYCIDVNYNKNNVNKIIQFFIKVKPFIQIKNNDKQEINYYENLNNLILETNPKGGIISNNLNITIENNLVKLADFEKKIGEYELKIKYIFNNTQNFITYNFKILPYIIYNVNNINIIFKQNYISDMPTVYPYDGIFMLNTKNNHVFIHEKTGIISITSGLNVGVYDLVIKYICNDLINFTNFKVTIKPTFNLNKNTFFYNYNPITTDETYSLEPIDVYPKGGTFTTDNFIVDKNGIISIPSKLEVGEYKINVKYSYLDIESYYDFVLNVLPYKLNCVFKQCEKIYDGTTSVNMKYITSNDIKLDLVFDAKFENKDVGFNKKIEISNVKILDNKNIIHDDVSVIGIIKNKKLNIIFNGIDKYYNGLKDAQVDYTIDNIITGDDVFIKSYECIYESAMVGTNKIIISKIILDGNDCKNYYTDLTYETYAKIKPKSAYIIFKSPVVTYTGSTNVNLEFDSFEGTNNEKILLESYNANFETPNIGDNIPITVTNITIFKNNNYIFSAKPLFGKINKKEITLTPIAINKIYDGTTKATVNFNDKKYNIISYEANYENKNVGMKKINITNIKSDNDNIIIKDITIFGAILPLSLIVNYNGENKIYDGTNTIKGLYEIVNKIDTDELDISVNFTFKNANVENNKEIIYTIPKITGYDASNYKLNKINVNKPHIIKKKIEIEFIGINKIYDNTVNANVKPIINDKSIKIKSYNAYFENKDVGENKKIIITDIVLLNDNYYLDTCYTYANIEKKQVTILTEAIPKEYDGTIDAEIKIINIIGVCFNDNMYVTNYKAEYQDANAGTNKIIKISNIEYGGTSNNNYYCKDFTVTSSILQKKLTFEISNNEKYYDGNTNININIYNDHDINVKSFSANFENSNVGNDKNIYVKNIILEKADINNYLITDFVCKGNILSTFINLNFIAKNKIYDSTNNAIVSLNENYKIKYEAYYEDINVGNNKKIIVKILSGVIPNYLLYDTYITYGNILPIEIKINPIITNKIYDETTTHLINFELSNNSVVEYCANFENCNVGNNKKIFITNIKLKDENYFCKDFITFGNILKSKIIMNFTVAKKIYDGTTKAIIENSNDITYYEANFMSPDIGKQNVEIKNVVLNNKNYIVQDCIVQAEILQKTIPINIIINEKEYDGTRTATIKSYSSNYNITIIDYEANFENEFISDNKKVILKNIKLDNNNYMCDDMILFSKITKRTIDIKFKEIEKYYDGTTNANLEINNLENIVNNEIVNILSYTAQYSNKICGDVVLNLADIILEGIHCNNYVVNKLKIQTKILKRKLKYTITVFDKKYDNNNYAFINIVLDNILNDEDVYIENFSALYNDETIGTNKEIKIKNIVIGGKDKNNYEIDNEIILYGNIIL